tara:strand:- start:56 stop:649 length:594 start_codon:yes stop_codon:yes gene_type:complete
LAILTEVFSTPIYETELTLDLDKILELVYKEKSQRVLSNMGGRQTEDLDRSTYAFLIDEIMLHAGDYFKLFNYNAELVFWNLWANINKYKDHNTLHHHLGSGGDLNFISGVVYIKTPKNCGTLGIEHPLDYIDLVINQDFVKHPNKYISHQIHLEPKENLLVLFPAYLKHFVAPSQNKLQDRISLSFNIGVKHKEKL